MANYKIIASVTTRLYGVGNRVIYTPAPARAIDPILGRQLSTDVVLVATGSPFAFTWTMAMSFGGYEVEVRSLTYTDLWPTVIEHKLRHPSMVYEWRPPRPGLYSFRVRALHDPPGPWVDSIDPPLDGARRGWIVQAYLAPVSGGGIR